MASPRERLADRDVPASATELAGLLNAASRELAGTDLADNPAVVVFSRF